MRNLGSTAPLFSTTSPSYHFKFQLQKGLLKMYPSTAPLHDPPPEPLLLPYSAATSDPVLWEYDTMF